MKTKTKMKTKIKMKIIFVWFLFLLSKSFCIFVNFTWTRGAIDGQLSLTWLRSALAFSFANFPRGLAVERRTHLQVT